MFTVKLIVLGEFWDSYIYSNRLYLFHTDGRISTLKWDDVVHSLGVPQHLQAALECAFLRSDYLYRDSHAIFFRDDDIRDIMRRKFDLLAELELVLDKRLDKSTVTRVQDDLFPFPHTDFTCYRRHVYVSSQKGIHYQRLGRDLSIPARKEPDRLWDCPVTSIAASWFNLATAAGSDGLFRLPLYDRDGAHRKVEQADQVTEANCVHCNWLYSNIYGSSHVGNGVFAAFNTDRPGNQNSMEMEGDEARVSQLEFETNVYANEIFHEGGYSWGAKDKLFLANGPKLKVVTLTPKSRISPLRFSDPDDIILASWKGEVVSGAVSIFGTILECDNAILILKRDGTIVTLPGEPVRYRVFNRSINYENQLHVIYDDRLEIHSYNEDYLVVPNDKRFGYSAI